MVHHLVQVLAHELIERQIAAGRALELGRNFVVLQTRWLEVLQWAISLMFGWAAITVLMTKNAFLF